MDSQDDFIKCDNCFCDVPAIHIERHCAFCKRNVFRCNCGEVMQFCDKEDHYAQYHETISCSDCEKQMEKRFLSKHLSEECSMRNMECLFCHLDLPQADFDAHTLQCGTRTEKCHLCNRYIMLRELEVHFETGCQWPEVKSKVGSASEVTPDSTAPGNLHRLDQYQSTLECPLCHASCLDFEDVQMHMLNTCPNRHKLAEDVPYNTTTLDGKQTDIDPNSWMEELYEKNDQTNEEPNTPTKVDDAAEMMIPCEICEKPIPLSDLINHQSLCFGSHPEPIPTPSIPNDNNNNTYNAQSDEPENQVLIPCEFCGNSFPYKIVSTHQQSCRTSHMSASDYATNEQEAIVGGRKPFTERLLSEEFGDLNISKPILGIFPPPTVQHEEPPNEPEPPAISVQGSTSTTTQTSDPKRNELERCVTMNLAENRAHSDDPALVKVDKAVALDRCISDASALNPITKLQVNCVTRFLTHDDSNSIVQGLMQSLTKRKFNVRAGLASNNTMRLTVRGEEVSFVVTITPFTTKRCMVELRRLEGTVSAFREEYEKVLADFQQDVL